MDEKVVFAMKVYRTQLGVIDANCYVLVDEKSGEAAVIDAGDFNENLKKILRLNEIKLVKYILLTHGHYDHIFGVYDTREYTGARVAIHEEDAACLYDEKQSLAYQFDNEQKLLKPDILLRDDMKLTVGDIEITVMHTPGHTKGGVCFICEKERIIFSGDTLFCKTCGRTDLPGGDWQSLKESLLRLVALKGDYTVYPGHNIETKLDFEKTHNRYLRKF